MEGESEQSQFNKHVNAIGPEIGKFLKRVRKNTGAKLRYLLVAEPHKSGLPHFHMLIHQCDTHIPVRYDDLKSQWRLGFSAWKLTDYKSASYVCKYLSKSLRARVRASQAYGTTPNALSLVRFPDVKNMTPENNMFLEPNLQRNEYHEFAVSSPGIPDRFPELQSSGLSTEEPTGAFNMAGQDPFRANSWPDA